MYDDGRGDARAWYNDGTWVAIDDAEDSDQTDDIDPQDSYYKALLSRYKKLQHQLTNADPSQFAARIQANPYIHVDTSLPGRRYEWLDTLENEYPTPARVHGISETNLFWALEFAGESLDHYDTISKQKSCWIWTLLALAGDRGTLDFTKIGRIRTLGRRAGQLGVRLREGARFSPPGGSEDEEVEDWVVDGHETDGEDDEPGPEDTLTAPPTQNSREKPTNHALRPDGVNDESADASSDEGEVREDSSDDEGEVHEDSNNTEAAALEAARARLLAQLGDRLIQPSVPPSPGTLRHKHNGKPCHDPKCDTLKQLAEANAKNTSSQQHQQQKTAASPAPPKRVFASRAEAEEQRQMLRENELKQQKSQTPNDAVSNPSPPPEKTQVLPRDIKEHAAPSADVKHGDDHDREEMEDEADPIDLNTRVTIDMILTVVAECYGQKDLLRYREVW